MHCAQLSRREKAKNGLGKVKLEKNGGEQRRVYTEEGETEVKWKKKKLTALKLTQGNREAWLGWW